jgi:hypothetical protein
VFAALLFTALAPAADTKSDAEKLADSLKTWEYSYQVRWSSAFGFGNTTTVTVKGNKVVERRFIEFGRPEGGKPAEAKDKWVESGRDIGTHKEGAPARTVDELYAEAKKVCEGKPADGHMRAIGFDKQGVLAYCYTRDTRIADDAPLTGVPGIQLALKAKK